MRQFCCVGQRCIDVVNGQGGIAGQDLVLGGALGKTVQYYCDWNPGPRCTEFTAADLWATVEELLPRRDMSTLRGTAPQRPLDGGRDSVTAVHSEDRICRR